MKCQWSRSVWRIGSQASPVGLNRRGAIRGSRPAAAASRYSRSTSSSIPTGGSSIGLPEPAPGAPQHLGERGPEGGGAPATDAGHRGQPSVVGGQLERLQRVHAQDLVQSLGERRPHAGNGPEELLGVEAAAQPLELAPAPRAEQLGDRGRDARADARQRFEALDSVALVDLAERLREARPTVRAASR